MRFEFHSLRPKPQPGAPSRRGPKRTATLPRTSRWRKVGSIALGCLAVAMIAGPPVLSQNVEPSSDHGPDIVVDVPVEARREKALADAVEAFTALGKTVGISVKCDLHHLCVDEQYIVEITPFYVQLFYDPISQPPIKLASFPQAAIKSASVMPGRVVSDGTQEAYYTKLQRSLAVLNEQTANHFMLYSFPNPQDNPFLPWPPLMPSSFEDVTASFQANAPLGEIAGQIRDRIAPRGYDALRYFSVPGGFAVATDLERVGRRRPVSAADRWTRGKRGGFGSLFDYWSRLLSGENDRFRVFVFIVTDSDIQHSQETAREDDLDGWKAKGRPALSRERAAAKALPGTRVWLYTYEFRASRSKGAELIQNVRDPLRNQQNKSAVGLP